ncbi:MAG: N-acetylmuramoyl-L-alanine amidase [Pseudanabaena sp. CAN_BIN31]|nr:N-acetylmuramoyl-L-alanine amidase [Pseudanabaena sp. CAN_BIN31]
MAINKIYLHWSATSYNFTKAGSYHTVVQGDGRVVRLTSYDQQTAHTLRRNSNAVGIACACMGGDPWNDFPPTKIQVENMCREAADLANRLGWKPDDIRDLSTTGNSVNRILTHAEAGANRDFPKSLVDRGTGVTDAEAIRLGLPHANYGPSKWLDGWSGGTVDRWDFFKVKSTDLDGSGGNTLRKMIREFMKATPSSTPPTASGSDCAIFLNNVKIATGSLLSDNRCYVKLRDLFVPFNIQFGEFQGGENPFVNLLSDKFAPKFLADSPLISGFPTVDIFLNRPIDSDGIPVGDARTPIQPFMGGILINDLTYVLIADFCSELGIPLTFDASVPAIRLTL